MLKLPAYKNPKKFKPGHLGLDHCVPTKQHSQNNLKKNH